MTQIQKHKKKRKESKTPWFTIVIYSAMRVGE